MSKKSEFSIPRTLSFQEFVECFNSHEDIQNEHEVPTDPRKLDKIVDRIQNAEQLTKIDEGIPPDPCADDTVIFETHSAFKEKVHGTSDLHESPPEDFLREQFFGCCDTFESMHKRVVSGLSYF